MTNAKILGKGPQPKNPIHVQAKHVMWNLFSGYGIGRSAIMDRGGSGVDQRQNTLHQSNGGDNSNSKASTLSTKSPLGEYAIDTHP
ncbi:hypothetical protein JCM33374_g6470 [Metschnikowia sp. JCM 33374]|nr:hypothetical protein JCM33374_g6470 [Metschnikowia sp. JCM 33374]